MSCTELFAWRADGQLYHVRDFQNSWLSAMFVWKKLAETYGIEAQRKDAQGNPLGFQDYAPLWSSVRKLAADDRWVLAHTFDGAAVRRADLPRLAAALRAFAARHPGGHQVAMAEALDGLLQDASVAGACWNMTSVNGDAWKVRVQAGATPEGDEYGLANIMAHPKPFARKPVFWVTQENLGFEPTALAKGGPP